jgi:hypothetical protein
VNPLAVVVYRNRQLLFGGLLADYVLIEKFLYLERLRNLVGSSRGRLDLIVFQDGIADRDTLVANICSRIIAWGRDELSDHFLALMTERAAQSIIGSGTLQAVFSYSAFGFEMPPG